MPRLKSRAASSTHKKVVVLLLDRTPIRGYLNPLSLGRAETIDLLTLDGEHRSLALDGREHGIAASIIHPGNTATSFGRQGTSAVRQEGSMTPEDVARVVLLMASLPETVNLLETVMLPVSMPFLGRG